MSFLRLTGVKGVSAEKVYESLCSQTVELVLTAHPTQAFRQSLLKKYAKVCRCSVQRKSSLCVICGVGVSPCVLVVVGRGISRPTAGILIQAATGPHVYVLLCHDTNKALGV